MLIGEYQHSVDAKGRMNIPVKLRDDLGETFIITKGLDNCLSVYPMAEWLLLEERTNALPLSKSRQLKRFLFAGAAQVEPDKQGRILIPQNLREYAGLQNDVVVVGVSNRAEIWDKARWEASNLDLTSESIAEAMDDLGF